MGGADAFCDVDSEKEAMVRSLDLILKPWEPLRVLSRAVTVWRDALEVLWEIDGV